MLGTSQFVPLGGYIHNGIYYQMRRSFFCTYLSVGRKVEKYRYFGTYVTLILVPNRTVVKLSTQVVDWVTSDAASQTEL